MNISSYKSLILRRRSTTEAGFGMVTPGVRPATGLPQFSDNRLPYYLTNLDFFNNFRVTAVDTLLPLQPSVSVRKRFLSAQ